MNREEHKMSRNITVVVLAILALSASADTVTFRPEQTEVVVDAKAGSVTRFAAQEATNFLSRVLGAPVPLVTAPTEGFASLILGTNAWSVAAGLAPEKLQRDAFQVKTEGSRVYIAGCDDPKTDVRRALKTGYWAQMFERATLFGVYDFLERFAGCRFYFPGELGEIVPSKSEIAVPCGMRSQVPSFWRWSYSTYWDGAWMGEGPVKTAEDGRATTVCPGKTLNLWRLRGTSFYVPYAHGLNQFHYRRRFAKTHPEYFWMSGGKREPDLPPVHPGQLCHTSGINEEIYRDIVSYLKGEDASVRGIPAREAAADGEYGWNHRNPYGKYISVMAQDGMKACECPNCQAAHRKDLGGDYANDLIWKNTADLARRLEREGYDVVLTQMSYSPYGRIPDFDLPKNIDVEVAQSGPWSVIDPKRWSKQMEEGRKWADKLGHKIALWNYPCKVYCLSLLMPDIPQMSPKSWGAYYKAVAPWSSGAFAESESDRFFFNHLNYYIYSRIAADSSVDVDAVLDEYYRLMFGAAAAEIKSFYESLEDKWVKEIAGKIKDTPLGPAAVPPSEYEIWTRIYGPDVLKGYRALFERATAAVKPGSLEARRIALVRDELLGSLERGGGRFLEMISVEKELARRAARTDIRSLVSEKGYVRPLWDKTTFETSPASITLVSTEKSDVCTHLLASEDSRLKPNTNYRISYFVKTENVEPLNKNGGAVVIVNDGKNRSFPALGATVGTVDWIHREFRFTTGPKANVGRDAYLRVAISQATGTAWFDGVELTEEK